jgi:multiple sugar transport system permease protein
VNAKNANSVLSALSGEESKPPSRWFYISNATYGFLLVLPALAIMLAIFIYPMVYSAYTSFRDFELTRPDRAEFIGLDNYREIVQDEEFQRALSNTIKYVAIAVPTEFVIGLMLAMALATIDRGRGVLRTLLIIPMMLAPVAMGLMWKFMYNNDLGIINYLLREFGVARPPLWLADPDYALYSIIIVEIWATVPIFILLLLAGLLSIPSEYYEAAKIDGASAFAAFRFITMPLLQPVIMVALLLRGMDAFRVFDIVYVLTKGGPALRSDVLSFYVYRAAFVGRDFGEATAAAWIMIIVLLLSGLALMRAMRRQGGSL